MAKVIAIFNQKGGVGKTTTTINLATCLAMRDRKVCMIDMDPQGNTTSGMGIDKKSLNTDVYECLMGDARMKDAIIHTGWKRLDLVPASTDLAGAEIEIVNLHGRELMLRKAMREIRNNYEYIFIDCPPSLGLLTINSLVAADSVLIPIQCEFYALEGVSQLMGTYELVRKNMNPDLDIQGVVLSMFDGRTNLSVQVVQEVKRYFGNKVYCSVIPRNVRLAEAPSYGQPIAVYDPKSKGTEAYFKLADEFIGKEER